MKSESLATPDVLTKRSSGGIPAVYMCRSSVFESMSSGSAYIVALAFSNESGGDGDVSRDTRFSVVVDEKGELDADAESRLSGGVLESCEVATSGGSTLILTSVGTVVVSEEVSSSTGANFIERMLRVIELSENGLFA